ncbi:ArsR/SmtB family transcription factor [Leifsonia poae]|uniref:ArsR/SmtB family transcription factor n=1 Tax=Leifsonia poae TaxID=110933 RepID=UPI003D6683F1
MAMTELLPLRDLQSCCAPITKEVISQENATSVAKAMKALADPARLRLLSMVAAHEDGEACVCDLTEPLALSQPTVSHHLKILVEAGYLSRSRRGTWAYYRIVPGSSTRSRRFSPPSDVAFASVVRRARSPSSNGPSTRRA